GHHVPHDRQRKSFRRGMSEQSEQNSIRILRTGGSGERAGGRARASVCLLSVFVRADERIASAADGVSIIGRRQ
ncbi:MAG: hypothetical protein GY820_44445, partial [Gammaproteobacteria bacterium]|nr:hypothetical protein [Gammaproteobacteria bacterium]